MTSDYKADVIVVGGGPAGSTAAAFLARAGRQVVLFEKESFPRYHIGESTLPGCMAALRELGVYEKILNHGFVKKPGVTWIWGKDRTEWPVFFNEVSSEPFAFQVIRSEFDNILLRHAENCGVVVKERHAVVEPISDNGRCVGVVYRTQDGEIGRAYGKYVVVASGQDLLRMDPTNSRDYDEQLNNVALWAYWRNCEQLQGRESGNIFSPTTPIGWVWYIPLHDGTTSIGIVVHKDAVRKAGGGKEGMAKLYQEGMSSNDRLSAMMARATQVSDVKTQRDWSYISKKFHGPGYLLAGDAAGFVDPLLSTGVFLAVTGGRLAAKMLDMCFRHGGDSIVEARAMNSYEGTYKSILENITAFVRYMYNSEATQDSYFWQAHRRVGAVKELTGREAFIYLISGEAGKDYVAQEQKMFGALFERLEHGALSTQS